MPLVVRFLLWALGLGPLGFMVAAGLTGRLGVNPVEAVLHGTGDWTLNFLMLVLLLGPLKKRFSLTVPLHQLAGRFAVLYAVLHLSIYVGVEHFFDFGEMWQDVLKHKRIIAGLGAALVLVAQFVLSLQGAIKRLGYERFLWVHRFIWLGGALGVLHYVLLVKKDIRVPLIYAAIYGALVISRLARLARGRLPML